MKTFFSLRESLDEISSNKLGDYMRASSADAGKPGASARRQDKRIGGQKMADDKIRKKMGYSSTAKVAAESVEQVDEISVKAMTDKIANSGSKGLKQTMKANKADELRKTLDAMKARLAKEEKECPHCDMEDGEHEDDCPMMQEKTLTPAEKKKREEIAKAIERDNPGMDMSKKMAIATATAKRVAEEAELDEAKKVMIRFKDQIKSKSGAEDDAKFWMKKTGGSSYEVYKATNGLWAYKIFEEAKPDAVEVMRKKQQMANISTSDKDKLAKIRAMLNKEKK